MGLAYWPVPTTRPTSIFFTSHPDRLELTYWSAEGVTHERGLLTRTTNQARLPLHHTQSPQKSLSLNPLVGDGVEIGVVKLNKRSELTTAALADRVTLAKR